MRNLTEWDTESVTSNLSSFPNFAGCEVPIESLVMACYTVNAWGGASKGVAVGNAINFNILWLGVLLLSPEGELQYPTL
jgi:hypothetical protein